MDCIAPLGELTLADVERVGGKAAHLGAMTRAGFAVPEGFVIDVSAFVSHFGDNTDPLVRPTTPMLQAELMAQVVQGLQTHLGDEPYVAVRSSSTTEDSQEASYAGLHSTYYFVRPSEIDQAILDCWMSLWSEAAIDYRRADWAELTPPDPARMAVIVQRMLPADRSGVTFSRDPVDGQSNDVVIEAAWGLGAVLVDGRVTPDHIRLSETCELIKYEISDKQHQVSPNVVGDGGQRLHEVAASLRLAPVLNDTEAEHIANVAHQLETLFESPQDVEWAYVGDQFYLLQSRPITGRPTRPDTDRQLVLFKPLAENFTEPLTPITQDLFATVLPKIGVFYNGRVYLDLAQVRRLNLLKLSDAELVDAALLKRAPESLKLKWAKVPIALLVTLIAYISDGANWRRAAALTPTSLAKYRNVTQKVLADTRISPRKALHRLIWGRGMFDAIGHRVFYANVSAGRYFALIGMLKGLVRRWAPDYPQENLTATFHGHADMQSMNMLSAMDRLAEQFALAIQEDDDASAAITATMQGKSAALPSHHPFTEAFESFLREFGHRGPREMELAAPSWRERPGALLRLLDGHNAGYSQEYSRGLSMNHAHGAYLAALDELHGQVKPWQRKVLDHIIARISHFIALRENTRHYHIMAFDTVRQKLLQVEQRLLTEKKLALAGDIFFLHDEQIQALDNGELDKAAAHAQIRRARRDWQRECKKAAPQTINIELPHEPTDDLGENFIKGQSACPGVYEGSARLIHNLGEAQTLEPGDVLFAPYTDPGWTPLFSRAGAIVVGTGSFLSHAGNVARELRVPCVVDASDCMNRVRSGQQVRVNATAGTVEILP